MGSSRRQEDEIDTHSKRMRTIMVGAMAMMMEQDSSMENDGSSSSRGGGSHSRIKYINRDREEGHLRLMKDYFDPNPTYDARMFRRHYRMQPSLFNRIMNNVVSHDPYFQQTRDALNKLSLSPHQKLTSALRLLANGCSVDSVDEYCRMGESTSLKCLRKFCTSIINAYGDEYLRSPNPIDLHRLLIKASERGFPGMIGSIDCMHWEWKKCPTSWVGQYTGYKRKTTIVLEAVASYDTWIWHAFFGTAGSNNDLNTLGSSPLFNDAVAGKAPTVQFQVNNKYYDQCYYLADGIYPSWMTFVKTISHPNTPQKKLFAAKQEAYRKDVERAFGILQARWSIVRGPARMWDTQTLGEIMLTCIILHNMIVEDEYVDDEDDEVGHVGEYEIDPNVSFDVHRDSPTITVYMHSHNRIRDTLMHHSLRNDLINHLWTLNGNGVQFL